MGKGEQDRAHPDGPGCQPVASAVPASQSGIPRAGERTRRTISPFATAPRNGTPFHILNTLRFNPLMERFEALSHHADDPGRKVWRPITFCHEPSVWLRRAPLPYQIPDDQWFPVAHTAYMIRQRRSLIQRVIGALFRRKPKVVEPRWQWRAVMADWSPASGIAAGTDETPQAAQPEGQEPDPQGDAR